MIGRIIDDRLDETPEPGTRRVSKPSPVQILAVPYFKYWEFLDARCWLSQPQRQRAIVAATLCSHPNRFCSLNRPRSSAAGL